MVADMLSRWVSRGAAWCPPVGAAGLESGGSAGRVIPLDARVRLPRLEEKSSVAVSVEVDLDTSRRSRVREGE
jgi:hypothetical protein